MERRDGEKTYGERRYGERRYGEEREKGWARREAERQEGWRGDRGIICADVQRRTFGQLQRFKYANVPETV